MKYYIMTIEQFIPEGAEAHSESSKVEKKNTEDSALGYFYDCLSTVAKSARHNFLDIKITKSDGTIIKKDVYGAYVEESGE